MTLVAFAGIVTVEDCLAESAAEIDVLLGGQPGSEAAATGATAAIATTGTDRTAPLTRVRRSIPPGLVGLLLSPDS